MKDDEYLKWLRVELCMTQLQLAESLGWKNRQQVTNIENGRKRLTEQTKLALSAIYMRRVGKWPEKELDSSQAR